MREYDPLDSRNQPMGVGAWVLTVVLMAIPIVNLVFYFMWLFGVGNRNRVQFIRAHFLVTMVMLIIFAIIMIVSMSSILAFFDKIVGALSTVILLP